MGKRSKLWIKMLAATTLLSAGLVWPGDTAYAAEGDVEISYENFPSEVFRCYIMDFIDKDKDGFLNQSEIDETIEINFGITNEKGELIYFVECADGIERFKNLKKCIVVVIQH